MDRSPSDITRLLTRARDGDSSARDALLGALYDELRALAKACFRAERPGHTLQATALVNEVCLRLLRTGSLPGKNRVEFLAFVAKAMRHLLVDHARHRRRLKRGAGNHRVALDDALVVEEKPALGLIALDEALERLSVVHPRKAQVVELRYFGGLSIADVADLLKISSATVKRDWEVARTWLQLEVQGDGARARIRDPDPGHE